MSALKPGLYIVPTPLGNLGDITLRALDVLRASDIILCEDTRVSGKLLQAFGISTKLMSYHEHNAERMRPKILAILKQEKVVALISDAGTPLINDPGFKLVREIHKEGIYLTSLPGPCSVITALTLSGFPTDHFVFCGFVNPKDFDTLEKIPYTLIFFSTPHKLEKDLLKMKDYFASRDVAVIREMSKLFEEVKYGRFDEMLDFYTSHSVRGEIVLILSPPLTIQEVDFSELDKKIIQLRQTMSVKDLAEHLSTLFPIRKREIYKRIIEKT